MEEDKHSNENIIKMLVIGFVLVTYIFIFLKVLFF